MTTDTRNGDHIHIPLESRIHRPKYVIHIKAVHIFIYQKYIFQLTEGGKCKKCSLTLSSLITLRKLFKLKDSHILSTAGTAAIYVLKSSRHCFFHHTIDAGLCRDSRHGYVLLTWSDTGLHDRIFTMCHCCNLDQPALVTCRSCISRKLRHGVSGIAVLIFLYTHTWDHFSLDHVFRIGDGTLVNG